MLCFALTALLFDFHSPHLKNPGQVTQPLNTLSNVLLHQVNFSQQKISIRDMGLLQLLLWLGCLNVKFKLATALNFFSPSDAIGQLGSEATRLVNQVLPVPQICVSRTLATELLAQKECFKLCIIESTWCSTAVDLPNLSNNLVKTHQTFLKVVDST